MIRMQTVPTHLGPSHVPVMLDTKEMDRLAQVYIYLSDLREGLLHRQNRRIYPIVANATIVCIYVNYYLRNCFDS